ncbi:hypothetical protein K438DRAFT_1775534 [Mycena galopus ATCC 62051]|nr:hypothetical protein K438DRAFT_1775534 [Mycena galopus ATCC 62051]
MRRTSSVLAMTNLAIDANARNDSHAREQSRRRTALFGLQVRVGPQVHAVADSVGKRYQAPLGDTSGLKYFPASDGLRELAKSIPAHDEEFIAQELKGIRDNADDLVEIHEQEYYVAVRRVLKVKFFRIQMWCSGTLSIEKGVLSCKGIVRGNAHGSEYINKPSGLSLRGELTKNPELRFVDFVGLEMVRANEGLVPRILWEHGLDNLKHLFRCGLAAHSRTHAHFPGRITNSQGGGFASTVNDRGHENTRRVRVYIARAVAM